MNEQMKLSQEEIDALLNANNSSSPGADQPASTGAEQLTSEEADILGEIGNISFGSAATSLSTLLQHRVDITTPKVSVIQQDEVEKRFPTPYVLVAVDFTEGLQGSNALAIEINDAKTIADLMLGGDGTNTQGELNELHLSAVGEAMNQMMGGAATSMSQMFGRYINISPPNVEVIDFSSLDGRAQLNESGSIVDVEFQLKVDNLIDSRIMQLIPLKFAKEIVRALKGEHASAPSTVSQQAASTDRPVDLPRATQPAQPVAQPTDPSGHAERPSAAASQPQAAPAPGVQIHRPEFADFDDPYEAPSQSNNLSLLFDVPLNVTVELGRAKKLIREILELSPGSILELDKLAGEPVDIYVNSKRIAIGEVVVIDENFGVRVTDIINVEQRVSS